jgi:hypothetical protein
MSGILDNKSRTIDAILTPEGRLQLAANNFSIEYATFSDKNVVYQADLSEGHVDPTKKIYLEAFQTAQDEIIFVADDSGNLVPFRQNQSVDGQDASSGSISSWLSFVNGKIKSRLQNLAVITSASFVSDLTGTVGFSEETLNGANFASQIQNILTSSLDNFKQNMFLGSTDPFFEDQDFVLNKNEITFKIPDNDQTRSMIQPTSVNTIDSLFNDEKLRNIENFKYLPPIKKTLHNNKNLNKKDIKGLQAANLFIGNYSPWGPVDSLKFIDISNKLKNAEILYGSETIIFEPTSRDNSIVAQIFEITNASATKLDVIDYGKVYNNSQNPANSTSHIFFLGKVIVDETGSDCFSHLFTLVFSNVEDEQ